MVLPYDQIASGWARVETPCENRGWVDVARVIASGGTPVGGATVVLDPGHGGREPGATGSGGLAEKDVNLDVMNRVQRALAARGVSVLTTRTGDYMATLSFRVDVARAVRPAVFLSLHHNAEPDELRSTPGTEAYYEFRSKESKRLTGLVEEEVAGALRQYPIQWAADRDAGAKWRLSDSGKDYYAVIRQSYDAGITASLVEAAFVSNPPEEALLRRDDVREVEAAAIARAIERFLAGERPGDVFTTPYPRTEPAGGGGGTDGCVDPV